LATKAKAKTGKRVSDLAKELGVTSKVILDRLKAEAAKDPDFRAPANAQSTILAGLVETIREWHATGTLALPPTAAGTGEPAPKPKPPRRTKKAEPAVAAPSAELAVAEPAAPQPVAEAAQPALAVAPVAPVAEAAQPAPAVAPVAPVAEPAPVPAPRVETPLTPEPAVAPSRPPAVSPEAPPVSAPVAPAPAPSVPVEVPPPAAPVVAPPPAPALAPAAKAPPAADPRAAMRPTVTLESIAKARRPVTPAPQLVVPAPAKMQGPRIIRTEKPDIVAAPRKRTPAQETPGPGFVQARAVGGRGVRVSEEDEEAARNKAAAKGRTNSSRRRGLDGRRGEAEAKLKEFSEADLEERRIRLGDPRRYAQGLDQHLKKSSERTLHGPAKSVIERGEPVRVQEPITVRSLAQALGVRAPDVIAKLLRQGILANVNQSLDAATAEMVALEYNVELKVISQMTLEEQLEQDLADRPSRPENLVPRPPVVTILGHVDHGKTTLLDKIRNANVAAGEAGGITQHIAAWTVTMGEGTSTRRVTFIDTPGHQAFTAMRARGAHMTDLVVLVVSAAEGVQPQTIESINHARAAEVPMVVALNKIDRPDANPEMVLGQLAGQGLNPVEWGGDVEVVRCSALTGKGIPELLETLDYQAQLLELKADPTLPARGTVIESRMDDGLGPIATVLVQNGTLRLGDTILAGQGYGRVRSLLDDRGEAIAQAGPSTPVLVSGLSALPAAGDKFHVVDDVDSARAIAEERQVANRQLQLAGQNRVTTANLLSAMTADQGKTINLIIKADVQGSLETLVNSVTGMNTAEVKARVIHAGVGAINESDVQLALATKAKPTDNRVGIIGFHVEPEETARALAQQHHIDVKTYQVIYEIFDDLRKALSGMLEPEVREKLHGHAEIRQVFRFSRVGNIAGCLVTDGHIQRGSKIRVTRNGVVVAQDLSLESLRRLKDDVREVKAGLECGIRLAGYDDIQPGDRLEAYSRETIERTL
jgi:translation initiation factor IF-2